MDTLDVILSLIRKKGITEQKFLADLGFNRTLLSDWKSGKSKSYQRHIARIADYFGVSADYLLRGEEAAAQQSEVPEDFVLLARKAERVPEEYRKDIYRLLESTIDIYIEAIDREREKRRR